MRAAVKGAFLGAVLCTVLTAAAATVAASSPKYYFRLREVKAGPDVDPALKAYAGDALKQELASRSEWASDINAQGDALVAELGKRHLKGFDVTVRIESIKSEVKEPAPGARNKRLQVNVGVTVFGTTIPEEKMAFSGDGETGLESEVSEKRMDAERISLAKDATKEAVKQAVDQAVLKLSEPPSGPGGGGKHKKKK
jgi:hypothetical protein